MKYYLAIDIGASSGRHIVGWREDGAIRMREVYHFPNGAVRRDGHLVWDTQALLREVKNGIEAAKREVGTPVSLAIDTWGWTTCCCGGSRRSCLPMPTGTAAPSW